MRDPIDSFKPGDQEHELALRDLYRQIVRKADEQRHVRQDDTTSLEQPSLYAPANSITSDKSLID